MPIFMRLHWRTAYFSNSSISHELICKVPFRVPCTMRVICVPCGDWEQELGSCGFRAGLHQLYAAWSSASYETFMESVTLHPTVGKRATPISHGHSENELDRALLKPHWPLRKVSKCQLLLLLHDENINTGCVFFSLFTELKKMFYFKNSPSQKTKQKNRWPHPFQYLPNSFLKEVEITWLKVKVND